MPTIEIPYGSHVSSLVRSASRRKLLVLAVEQMALALALVLGGAILLLILGTQILDWYWLALLLGIGIVFVLVRVRTARMTEYRVAQLLDHRMSLNDAISTAWFLLFDANAPKDPVSQLHLQRAEELARLVSPSQAFPFSGQRAWAVTGLLGTAALSLFAVRYFVTDSLSLRASLIPFQLSSVFERIERAVQPKSMARPDGLMADRRGVDVAAPTDQQRSMRRNDAERGEEMQGGQPDEAGSLSSPNRNPNVQQQSKTADQNHAESKDGNQSQATGVEKGQPQASDKASDAQQASTKEQPAKDQHNASGLVDRMKDALSNLMAKMRQSASEKSGQNGDKSSEEQKSGEQSANAERNGQTQQESKSQQASQEQNSEGQAQGQTAEKSQASQGRSSSEAADKKNSEAKSGIGRQDGDKDLREAEQLKAMGKLAEIIGKRSASVTGEMMVETPNGKQQLKTEYSQRVGHHTDLGGEINRDEIPLEDQQYVREYMEQVRKQGKAR